MPKSHKRQISLSWAPKSKQTDCSLKIKRRLLLGRKNMTKLHSRLKKQRLHFASKGPHSQGCGVSSIMYECESWTIKRAERPRIEAFQPWCWRRLLGDLWTARRSNKSILKEISPEYSLEGLMLKLKLQYFGHLMRRADSSEKTLLLGKIEGGRRMRRRWLDGITDSGDMNLSKLW